MGMFLHWFEQACDLCTQLGSRVVKYYTLPRPLGWVIMVSMATTLVLRGGLVWIFGQEDGRWWVPPGMIMIWVGLFMSSMYDRNPLLWYSSRLFGFVKRFWP